MGKTRRKNKHTDNSNPIAVTSVKSVLEEKDVLDEAESISDGASDFTEYTDVLENLLEQLKIPTPEEKESALNSLVHHVENLEFQKEIFKHEFIRIIAPLMIDTSLNVRRVAAGLLRNLSASSSLCVELTEMMVDQDIMTPLVALLKQYTDVPVRCEITKSNKSTDEYLQRDVFVQAANLLWNLCENNNTAVKIFIREGLLMFLLKFLDINNLDLEIAIPIAQCLQAVTDDNPNVIETWNQHELFLQLLDYKDFSNNTEANILFKTLIAGNMVNFNNSRVNKSTPLSMGLILDTLVVTLKEDHRQKVVEFADSIVREQEKVVSRKKTLEFVDCDKLQLEYNKINQLITAQQLALEIITNICSVDDGNKSDDESTDDSIEACDDDTIEEVSAMDDYSLTLSSEVEEMLIKYKFVDQCLNKANLPTENNIEILNQHFHGKKVMSQLYHLQYTAFLCLHNLITYLNAEDMGGLQVLHDLWCNLVKFVSSQTDEMYDGLFYAATSTMRTSIQRLAEGKWKIFDHISSKEVEVLLNNQVVWVESSTKVNLVRIASTLGMMLRESREPEDVNFVKFVGTCLLDMCSKESEVWIIAESLDALFDLFGEECSDQAASQIHIVDRMKVILPILKHKIKQQRKTLGEHTPIVMTAKTNLVRFIKYKTNT